MEQAARPARSAPGLLDHQGVWSCVLYGNPGLGEERVLLRFEPDGSTEVARATGDTVRPWAPASGWSVVDRRLTFSDPRTGREFSGDLNRSTLGGLWRSATLAGGWWCKEADERSFTFDDSLQHVVHLSAVMPQLHPLVMATPPYPREAIRRGRQGRAVVCFMVNSDGQVFSTEVLELSDEIFRQPSLDSLTRSRYRGWDDDTLVRPGCRTFVYRLDAIYD